MGARSSFVIAVCALLVEFSYPVSEKFVPGGLTVTLAVERCPDTLRITETYEAMGRTLGSSRVTYYPLADSIPEPAPDAPGGSMLP